MEGGRLVEVGREACWSLSSAKPGFGIEQLRDDNLDTYWQSDGPQPHTISVQWHRRVCIEQVSLYLSFAHDESYTPCHMSIRVGTTFHDLRDIKTVEMEEPNGWVHIPLSDEPGTVFGHLIQVAVLANHQNGRDSHVRQVKVFGPSRQSTGDAVEEIPHFDTSDFSMFSIVR